jgi:hypothetical protein
MSFHGVSMVSCMRDYDRSSCLRGVILTPSLTPTPMLAPALALALALALTLILVLAHAMPHHARFDFF